MKAVDQKVEEIVGILLHVVVDKCFILPSTEVSERSWPYVTDVVLPQTLDEIRVQLRHDAVRSFPVLFL